jgi:hypothetical protein
MFNPLGKEKLLLGQWVDVELDLADGGQHYFNDFELHLIHDYRTREYTVQFSETDFGVLEVCFFPIGPIARNHTARPNWTTDPIFFALTIMKLDRKNPIYNGYIFSSL